MAQELERYVIHMLLAIFILTLPVSEVLAGPVVAINCGDLKNHVGPYDYRFEKKPETLGLVEKAHFTTGVERLTRGATGAFGHDIDYTLRAFPNHHRALMSMIKLSKKEKKATPTGAHYTVECYLERAERFQPEDMYVKYLKALYLIQEKRIEEARPILVIAHENPIDSPLYFYNLGLSFIEVGDIERAQINAQKAYASGITLPGLMNKLKRIGAWQNTSTGDQSNKQND